MEIKINFHGVIFVLLPWNSECTKTRLTRTVSKWNSTTSPRRNASLGMNSTKNFSHSNDSTSSAHMAGEKHCWIILLSLSLAFFSLFSICTSEHIPLFMLMLIWRQIYNAVEKESSFKKNYIIFDIEMLYLRHDPFKDKFSRTFLSALRIFLSWKTFTCF